jgi:3-hydroxybutyryl-CoA dehydrogenase
MPQEAAMSWLLSAHLLDAVTKPEWQFVMANRGDRRALALHLEAIFALMDGTGSAADIDAGARLGLNHPMGPLELSDFIGNDVVLNVMDVLHRGFGDPKFRAAPLLRQMVSAGHLGRKAGRGFYRYDADGRKVGT